MDNIYLKLFIKKCVLILILLALFFSGFVSLKHINRERMRHRFPAVYPTVQPPQDRPDLPVSLILTSSLLGGFRSVLVNFLWIRAQTLQQEGRFFELVQLFDWIGRLQPMLQHVWVFSAWNMAYNISAELPTPEDRWLWVLNGISTLRDRGLLYNKNSAFLLREIAWIFNNKIAGMSDDFHWHYKQRLAEIIQRALGGGDVRTLIGLPDNPALLDKGVIEFSRYMKTRGWRGWNDFSPIKSLEKLQNTPEEEAFLRSLGKRYITDHLRMDIDFMYQLQRKYPGVDWRDANAHSLYWASRAEKITPEDDFLATQRLIYFSLLGIFRQGNIRVSERQGRRYFIQGPQIEIAQEIKQYFNTLIKNLREKGFPIVYMDGIRSAYRSFLEEAVISLYLSKRMKSAMEFYSIIKRDFPSEDTRPSLEHFVLGQIAGTGQDLHHRNRILIIVYGLMREAFLSLAIGDEERFEGSHRIASAIWRKYQSEFEGVERMSLPALEEIRGKALDEILLDETISDTFKDNLKREMGLK